MLSHSTEFNQAYGLPSYYFYCYFFINPLILGDNPFTKKAATAGCVTLFMVWNPECQRKRASKWALKNVTDTFLCVCFAPLNNRPIRVGRKDSKWPVKVQLLFCELSSGLWDVEDQGPCISTIKLWHLASCILFWAPWGPTSMCTSWQRSGSPGSQISNNCNNSKVFKKCLGFFLRFRKFLYHNS